MSDDNCSIFLLNCFLYICEQDQIFLKFECVMALNRLGMMTAVTSYVLHQLNDSKKKKKSCCRHLNKKASQSKALFLICQWQSHGTIFCQGYSLCISEMISFLDTKLLLKSLINSACKRANIPACISVHRTAAYKPPTSRFRRMPWIAQVHSPFRNRGLGLHYSSWINDKKNCPPLQFWDILE